MNHLLYNKTAVITGASSGIGAALARAAAAAHCSLALTARREDRLTELKKELEDTYKIRVFTRSCDVRDAGAMSDFIREAAKTLGGIDLVFANAGFTIPGAFADLTPNDYRNIFDTNFCGMLNTLYPSLPFLKKSSGLAVIMGSILGEFGIMDRSAYAATKFALRGFYESVRYEFKEKGIRCLLAEPGFVKTELRYMDKHGNRLPAVSEQTVRKTSHGIAVPPEAVAAEIMRNLPRKGYKKRIVTGHAKLFNLLNRTVPGLLAALVYAKRDFFRKKVVK